MHPQPITPLIWFRSLLFNIALFAVMIILLIFSVPLLLLPRWFIYRFVIIWGGAVIWLMRVIVGTRLEIRGMEYLPTDQALMIASKHQSMWETMTFLNLFRAPVITVKYELLQIPFFGWVARKAGMVGIRRGDRQKALKKLVQDARKQAIAVRKPERDLVIFPEGTRTAIGARPRYLPGAALLYRAFNRPCVPVALNSGMFWPRRSFYKYPGTMVVEILPAISPGLDIKAFRVQLSQVIEQASEKLCQQAEAEWKSRIKP